MRQSCCVGDAWVSGAWLVRGEIRSRRRSGAVVRWPGCKFRWLCKYFVSGETVLFHPGEQRARLGHTGLCLAASAVTCSKLLWFAPKKIRDLDNVRKAWLQDRFSSAL